MSFSLYIYIYIEKKVFYNIEGQLRGLQGSNYPKACTLQILARIRVLIKHLYPQKATKNSLLARLPAPLYGRRRRRLKILAKVPGNT
jgi:hypothetical protein